MTEYYYQDFYGELEQVNSANGLRSMAKGVIAGSVLPSAARTANTNSDNQTNPGFLGGHFVINVSSITSSPSITVTIQGLSPVSGVFYPILSSPAITTTGTTILKVYPGIGQSPNGSASDILPSIWRVSVAHANANSITYSVDYSLSS